VAGEKKKILNLNGFPEEVLDVKLYGASYVSPSSKPAGFFHALHSKRNTGKSY
jgi:hypothetical protein